MLCELPVEIKFLKSILAASTRVVQFCARISREYREQLIVSNATFKSQEATYLTVSHGRVILRAFF